MAKFLKKFETQAAYEAAESGLILPNVSLTVDNNTVHYNPSLPPETRVVAKYNVTSTSSPTALRTNYEQNIFKSMEIDGVMLGELVTEYTFDTTGVHTVKYELYDETKLGNQAPVFNNSNLVECIIPDSVTSIGQNVFAYCSGLTSCTIGSGVTSIGNVAFQNCTGLTSINIPNGVTTIGSSAFQNCSSLTSIEIPSSVTSIGSGAFHFCSSLVTAVINSNAALIFGLFNSSSLQTVTIGNDATSIGSGVFNNCSSLTTVTIGNSVTSIGDTAFQGCSSLTSITSNATTAPTIQSETFRNVKTGGTLTVLVGSTGYDVWMGADDYYLGSYNWTKVEQ